jgi:ubiquinone/menaquinone biosynthesis C-methylase UbiE
MNHFSTPDISPPISDALSIAAVYRGKSKAKQYCAIRFESELMRLLHQRQVASVQGIMRDHQPVRSLEVAPGPGRITRDIIASGELDCLELNEGMIEEGKQHCDSRVRWIQGSAFDLPFDPCTYDFAYSFRFIRHFHYQVRRKLLLQLNRVIKPDGFLVIDAVNQLVSGPLRKASKDAYPIYDKLYENEQSLRQELSEFGFEVVHIDPVQRWFHRQYQAQILLGPRSPRLCRAVIRLLERMGKGPSLEWIVTARKRSEPQ